MAVVSPGWPGTIPTCRGTAASCGRPTSPSRRRPERPAPRRRGRRRSRSSNHAGATTAASSSSSDRTGWWNLYRASAGGAVDALCPMEAEFGLPQWVFGSRRMPRRPGPPCLLMDQGWDIRPRHAWMSTPSADRRSSCRSPTSTESRRRATVHFRRRVADRAVADRPARSRRRKPSRRSGGAARSHSTRHLSPSRSRSPGRRRTARLHTATSTRRRTEPTPGRPESSRR